MATKLHNTVCMLDISGGDVHIHSHIQSAIVQYITLDIPVTMLCWRPGANGAGTGGDVRASLACVCVFT